MLKAKVTKETVGVPDGQVYPTMFRVGDEVTGDLARDAIESGWGVQTEGELVTAQEPAQQGGEQQSSGGGASAEIVVPDGWEKMESGQLLELAAQISGGPVDKLKTAKDIIKAYVSPKAE